MHKTPLLLLTVCMMGVSPVMAETLPAETYTATNELLDTEKTSDLVTSEEENISKEQTTKKSLDETLDKILKDDSGFMDSSSLFDSKLYSNNTFGASLSEIFGELTGTEISQEELIDISAFGGALDSGQLNMQFLALSKDLTDSAFTDESGKALDATSIFSSTYGDLASQLAVDKAQIPADFNTSTMMKSASKTVNDTYKKTMQSSAYQNVKNKISIGSILNKAKKGPSTPIVNYNDLASNSKLASMTKSASSGIKGTISSEYQGDKSSVNSFYKNTKSTSEKNTSGKKYGDADDHKLKTPKSPSLITSALSSIKDKLFNNNATTKEKVDKVKEKKGNSLTGVK